MYCSAGIPRGFPTFSRRTISLESCLVGHLTTAALRNTLLISLLGTKRISYREIEFNPAEKRSTHAGVALKRKRANKGENFHFYPLRCLSCEPFNLPSVERRKNGRSPTASVPLFSVRRFICLSSIRAASR